MINKNDLRKAISSIAISNAKRNTIYKAFSDLASITKEEFDSVKSDISKVVESMLTKDTVGKANGVASLDSNGSVPIEQLGNIDTTLFLIVRELPTTDIKANKIYLVPNQDGQGNNVYIEYLYVENVWEKLGEFKPEVNLSEYVKSNEIYQCIKKEYDSSIRGTNAVAIDDTAVASEENAIALGCGTEATATSAIAIGYNAQATRNYNIALGGSAYVGNDFAIAIGCSAEATGSFATALGCGTKAIDDSAIAIGSYAKTSTFSKYALGGYESTTNDTKNLEEITRAKFGNKKYLIGLGGYDGTNLVINNAAGEKALNPNIKSVQQIINEKADTSAIPTKLSQLTNDANFITSYIETDPVWTSEKGNYYTKTEINNKGYLTAHQSLDAYAKKTEIPNVSTKADLVNGKLKAEQLPKLVNITTASTAEEVVTKFNALLADLKAKGYMEADIAQ